MFRRAAAAEPPDGDPPLASVHREWRLLMLEILEGFPNGVLAFAAKGRVTKRDYETLLIPAVEERLKRPGKVRVYYQFDLDFSGMDPGAMWDDFKVGMGHIPRWERVAVVTDVAWIRHAMGPFGFLIPALVKVFPLSETATAREWISAAGTNDVVGT
jgi:hypothetical protein